ncbi:MAG: hypothetical protein ACE14P_04540 [Methanotrichaceae archaeon]
MEVLHEYPYLYNAFSPRLPMALMYVAKDMHPDMFKEINMSQEVCQYDAELYEVHA